jgi:hypothetical protein
VSLSTINSEAKNQSDENKSLRKYLLSYLVVLAILLGLIGGINLIIDPQGRLRVMDVPGVNYYKVATPLGARTGKSQSLRLCQYDTVIFGTSRAETALNPDYAGLGGGSGYNAGLKATTMFEINRMSKYMLRYQQPEKVLLGLDFISFNEKRHTSDDYAESPIAESQEFLSIVRYLFSLGNLTDSWYTWRVNKAGNISPCYYKGYLPRSQRKKVTPRFAFDKIIIRYVSNPELYGAYVLGEEHYESLDQMLRELAAADIAVFPFISPIHALQTEALIQQGLWSAQEEWKRRMLEIIDGVNRDFPANKKIRLWDFSGYNTITMEPLPAESSGEAMRWFHDAAHYSQQVGNFVIDKVLATSQVSAGVPQDFGVLLIGSDIQPLLEAQRARKARYQSANPSEVAHISELIESQP